MAAFEGASTLRRRASIALTITAVVVTAALANQWSEEYLRNVVDDSLISMQYAKRLALGDGLVFNPGERVEGYTNFLWTVALAPIYWMSRLFRGDFVEWSVATSIVVACADLVLLACLARRLWGDRLLPLLLALGLCALDNSYTVWAMMALESHFVAFWALLTLVVWTSRWPRRALVAGACLACVPMARPDGMIFVGAFALSEGLALVPALLRGERALGLAALRRLAALLGVFAVVFGAYFAWRYSYYGYPFPNTYYLKVGSSRFDALERGIGHVKAFFEDRADIPLFALAIVPWLGNPLIRTLAIWVVVHTGYVAWVGGDFYPGHRFLVQLLPAFALLIGHVVFGVTFFMSRPRVDYWLRRIGVRRALIALLALSTIGTLGQVFVFGIQRGPLKLEIRAWRYMVDQQRRYMTWLSTITKPDEYICAGDIGSAGIYANLRVIDYYGVIDPVVAHKDVPTLGRGKAGHEKTADPRYVLERRPKYIKFGYLPGIFWANGYWFKNDLPGELGIAGLWVRDDLPGTGQFDEQTAIRFAPEPYPGWVAEGLSFAVWPVIRPGSGQIDPIGVKGQYLSSFHPSEGDRATGRIRSAPISLVGDRMVLRVGGGRDPERLRVSLLIDGQRKFSETGGQSEMLGQREWDIGPLKGQEAVLEVVDAATGPWGHITVDEIVQWTRN